MPSQIDVVGEMLVDENVGEVDVRPCGSNDEARTTWVTAYIVIVCGFDMSTKKSVTNKK
jgi:hypothetical protein